MNGTITYTGGPVPFFGTTTSHIDIVSVGLEYRWDAPAAPPRRSSASIEFRTQRLRPDAEGVKARVKCCGLGGNVRYVASQ